MAKSLIGRRTLVEVREYLVGWTLREIDDEFSSAGISPSETTAIEVSGARRHRVEMYYASLDLTRESDAKSLVSVFENILMRAHQLNPDGIRGVEDYLRKDGYVFENSRLRRRGTVGSAHLTESLGGLDAQGILDAIKRMEDAIEEDPDLAIGSAKELIESVCKTILHAAGDPVADANPDLSEVVKATTKLLKLAPGDIPKEAKGSSLIRTTLHNLASIVGSIGELRSLYGTGHGKKADFRGLQPRHARLVTGAASTLVTFLWDTHTHRDSAS